jgi:ribosome biogenesis GTP-binding protein YsxC/EngB
MKALSQAEFWRAAGRAADLPPPGAPEIAFAGRSNVGKSSALNALAGRKALARTSKTPGRTQTINFYTLGEAGLLVDLPGYGYARVPLALRAQWGELVGEYVRSRATLVGVVFIDARTRSRHSTGSSSAGSGMRAGSSFSPRPTSSRARCSGRRWGRCAPNRRVTT